MSAVLSRDMFPAEVADYSNSTFPAPRLFQRTAHEALRKGFTEGHKRQIIMAPTGGGKTYLGLRIAHESLIKGKRAVFLCDRITLIDQTSRAADSYGLDHGVIQAEHHRRKPWMPFQIASAQTIDKRGFWPETDVLIIDEAHTQLGVWTEYIHNTKAAVIGLSATPFSKGLGKHFTNLINATTMHELTQQGVLVKMRVKSCKRINMEGAAVSGGGEWTDGAAEERGMEIIGDVVTEWVKHGENRKTIVFGATIDHCKELARQFNEAFVTAAVFTSETTKKERDQLIAEFGKPDSAIRVLISVEALAKGFDVPDVGCVVDCRPLRKSLSTFMQMVGRGARSSPATGKTDFLLLDHSGNIARFGTDFTDIYFNGLESLDMGEKLDKQIRKEAEKSEGRGCPSCGFKPFFNRCMSCGFEKTEPAKVEAVAGEMQEVDVVADRKKRAEDQRNLWNQLCSHVRASGTAPEKQRGRAYYLFRDITGAEPPGHFRFEEAPIVSVPKDVKNKIKSLNIRFVKGMAKAQATA